MRINRIVALRASGRNYCMSWLTGQGKCLPASLDANFRGIALIAE